MFGKGNKHRLDISLTVASLMPQKRAWLMENISPLLISNGLTLHNLGYKRTVYVYLTMGTASITLKEKQLRGELEIHFT